MKKLLALVLAMVMTLGLATVSTSAALSDFSDASDVNYEEAMAVMNAVGVFVGDNGKLAPKDNLTRAAAAKIIAYLNLGESAAESLSKDVTAFTDVPAGNWATGYITYCYNAGIIAGDGTGKFYPNNTVTGLEFAKMLLVTLGYEADREGLVGKDYALNTTKLAATNDLFAENEDLSVNVPATREEAALYAFNALKAPTYAYATASTTIKGADGLEVLIGGSNAAPVDTGANIGALGDGAVLQLGEKLYKGDLKITNVADDMGRPAEQWLWKNKQVAESADKADHTVVVSKANKKVADIIDDINKSYDDTTADTYSAGAGKIVKVNGGTAATTAATNLYIGDVVEVYLSSTTTNQVINVAVTSYSAAKVTGAVATRTDSGVEQVRVPGVVTSWTDAENVHGYADLAKDDIVYFYRDKNNAGDWYLFKAASFDGQVTRLTTGTPNKYTIGGTQYVINGNVNANVTVAGLTPTTAGIPAPVYNTDYRFWTDGNGYIIYGKELENTSKDYALIYQLAYVAGDGSIGNSAHVEARIVKMDGSTEIVKVKSIKFSSTATYGGITVNETSETATSTDTLPTYANKWMVYKQATVPQLNGAINALSATKLGDQLFTMKNTDDGYEFTYAGAISGVSSDGVAATTNLKPSTGNLGGVAVNDSTVFIVRNNTTDSTPKFTVYTGKSSVPEFGTSASFTYAAEKSVATAIVVWNYGTKATTGEWIYLLDSSSKATTEVKEDSGSTTTYYVWDAYVDGKVVELNLSSTANTYATTNATGHGIGLYTPTYDTDGYVTALDRGSNQYGAFGYNLNGGVLSTGKTYGENTYAKAYNAPSDAPVIVKDTDDNYTVVTVAELDSDANDVIYTTLTNANDNKIKVAYVIEKDTDENGLASVVYNDVVLTAGTSGTATIEGSSSAYTPYTNATQAASKALTVLAEAGSRIVYNTTGWTATNFSSGTTVNNGTFNIANVGTSDVVYYVKVIAEDTTVSYYQITIDAA